MNVGSGNPSWGNGGQSVGGLAGSTQGHGGMPCNPFQDAPGGVPQMMSSQNTPTPQGTFQAHCPPQNPFAPVASVNTLGVNGVAYPRFIG